MLRLLLRQLRARFLTSKASKKERESLGENNPDRHKNNRHTLKLKGAIHFCSLRPLLRRFRPHRQNQTSVWNQDEPQHPSTIQHHQSIKKTITETNYDNHEWNQDPPENLIEHIAWLEEKLQSIPEEFRESAFVKIYADEEYGDPTLIYKIWFSRPETDNEEATRERQDQARAESVREREIAELAKLRAKYESEQTTP